MRRLAILILFVLFVPALSADTLLLRNGKKIEGQIIGQSKFQVRIRTANGVKSVSKGSIRRIKFGAFDPGAAKKKAEEEKRRREARRKKREEERRRKAAAEKKKAEADRKEPRKAEKKPTSRPARPRPTRRPSVSDAPFSSALIPGRGQLRQGREGAGYVFGGAFASFAMLGIALELENLRLIGETNARQEELALMIAVRGVSGDSLDLWQTLRLDTARERTNSNIRLGNSIWLITGLIYAANLVDFRLASGASLSMGFAGDGAVMALRVRF